MVVIAGWDFDIAIAARHLRADGPRFKRFAYAGVSINESQSAAVSLRAWRRECVTKSRSYARPVARDEVPPARPFFNHQLAQNLWKLRQVPWRAIGQCRFWIEAKSSNVRR